MVVEQDAIGLLGAGEFKTLSAGFGFEDHKVAVRELGEGALAGQTVDLVVVHQQQADGGFVEHRVHAGDSLMVQ